MPTLHTLTHIHTHITPFYLHHPLPLPSPLLGGREGGRSSQLRLESTLLLLLLLDEHAVGEALALVVVATLAGQGVRVMVRGGEEHLN